MKDALRIQWQSEEAHEAKRQSMLGNKYALGSVHTKQWIEKASNRQRRYMRNGMPLRTRLKLRRIAKAQWRTSRKKMLRSMEHRKPTIITVPNTCEKKLDKILQKVFPGEFKLNVKGGMVIGGMIPDFVNCNGKKVIVEMFGDYWHGEEKTGRSPDEEESRRRKAFAKYGFKTIIVWERELRNSKVLRRRLSEEVTSR